MKMNKYSMLFGVGLLALSVTGCAMMQRIEDKNNVVGFAYGPGQEAEIERIITNPDGVASGFYNELCYALRRSAPPPAGSTTESNQEVLVKTLLKLVKEKKFAPIEQSYVLGGIIAYEYNGVPGTEEQKMLSEPSERTRECIQLWSYTKKNLGIELFDHASLPTLMEAVKAGKAEIPEERMKLQFAVLQDDPKALGFKNLREVKMGDNDWTWEKQKAYRDDQAVLKTFNNEKNSPRGIALRKAVFGGGNEQLLVAFLGSDDAIRNYLTQAMPKKFGATEKALLLRLMGNNNEHFDEIQEFCSTVLNEALSAARHQRDGDMNTILSNVRSCKDFLFERHLSFMTSDERASFIKGATPRYLKMELPFNRDLNLDEYRQRVLKSTQSKEALLEIFQTIATLTNNYGERREKLDRLVTDLPEWVWQDEAVVLEIAQHYSKILKTCFEPSYNTTLLAAIEGMKDPSRKEAALLSIKECFTTESSCGLSEWARVKAVLEKVTLSDALIKEYLKDEFFTYWGAEWERAEFLLRQLPIPEAIREGTEIRKQIRTKRRKNYVWRSALQNMIVERFDALPSVEEKIAVIDATTSDTYAFALIKRLLGPESKDKDTVPEEAQARLNERKVAIIEAAQQRADAAELSGRAIVVKNSYIGQSEDDLWIIGPNCRYNFDKDLNVTEISFDEKQRYDVFGIDDKIQFLRMMRDAYDLPDYSTEVDRLYIRSQKYQVEMSFNGTIFKLTTL